jgi:hypothetical protein
MLYPLPGGIAFFCPLQPLINTKMRQRRSMESGNRNAGYFVDLLLEHLLVTQILSFSRQELD